MFDKRNKDATTEYLEISSKCKFNKEKKEKKPQTGTTHSSATHKFHFIFSIWTNLFSNCSLNEITQIVILKEIIGHLVKYVVLATALKIRYFEEKIKYPIYRQVWNNGKMYYTYYLISNTNAAHLYKILNFVLVGLPEIFRHSSYRASLASTCMLRYII